MDIRFVKAEIPRLPVAREEARRIAPGRHGAADDVAGRVQEALYRRIRHVDPRRRVVGVPILDVRGEQALPTRVQHVRHGTRVRIKRILQNNRPRPCGAFTRSQRRFGDERPLEREDRHAPRRRAMPDPARRIRAHTRLLMRPAADDRGVVGDLVADTETNTPRLRSRIADRLAHHHARTAHRDERRHPFVDVPAHTPVLQDRTPCVQRLRPGTVHDIPPVNRPDGLHAPEAEQAAVGKRTPPPGAVDARNESAEVVRRHAAVRLERTRHVPVPQHRRGVQVRQLADPAAQATSFRGNRLRLDQGGGKQTHRRPKGYARHV